MKKRIVGLLLAMVMALGLISVVAAASGDVVSADWSNFRNSEVNMALTEAKTPVDAETTVLKWANKLMTTWTDAPSVQIIVDNALIVMHGTKLSKLDLKTGEIIQQATMTAAPNYGYTPATYADGLIFCPLSGGTIQAFDAKTLESKWIFKDELGGQSLSPITYSDGCIYTGFWSGDAKDANYVCVNVADGSLKWSKTVTGGFYWAGSVVLGDTVIVGCDDGAKGYAGDSHLYSMNKKSGEVITDLTLTGCGDQRSAIVYSEEKGRVYFTAKNGYLCSAAVDTAAGTLSDLKTVKQANQCTSTPVVYGDQVYFSCGSGVVQGEGGDGNFVVADADTLEQLYVVALQAYPQGSVLVSKAYLEETGKLYCYSTYNGKPGGLSLIKVDPTKDTADGAELIEIYDAKGYEQNCITSPICGADGTIYYKNDSGNVLAVGINNAYLAGLTATVGAQKGEFSASDSEIEWVVPIGTESVTFAPTACEGGTVTVNGGAADTAVSLVEETATATIAVTKGEDSRTYTVSVREISADVALNELKVNEANSYTGKALALTPEFVAGTYYYGMYTAGSTRKFENVWPTANDANATVTVYAISNVKEGKFDAETGEIGVTGTNQNHDRYAIYFADDTLPMAVRIVVTAENGDTAEYVLVMSKEAAAEAGATLLTQIQAEDKLKADKAAAQPVIEMIDAIGEVELSDADAIEAARKAYEALTENQKALVTNAVALTAAETRLEEVKDENTAEPVDVQVTIAVSGKVVMALQTVTVTDVNNNGIFDVDDALYAAHEAGYEGGAKAGYASEETAWGLSIAKLWGDTSYAYGYWLDNASCWSLEDEVSEGDHLVAFVYRDTTAWSDTYTKLDKSSYTVEAFEELIVTLEKAGYDADWNTVFAAHAGASLTVYDSELKAVDEADYTVTDNGDGTYTVKVAKAGTYYLVASDDDPLTVPAVSEMVVVENEDLAAAEAVDKLIDAIGEVELSDADAIEAARAAYEDLTDEQKTMVKGLAVLEAAEDELEKVKDANTEVPVEVYVTISDVGNVVVALKRVTVTDVNNNGIFDVDDALYAAHEESYEGGAKAGYASSETQWGLGISMLWGDTSYAYGYWLDNASCWSLEDEVSEGDHLVAFVYRDTTAWSDTYTKLDKFMYSVEETDGLTVTLEKAGYDANWNTVFAAHAGAVLTVYDSELKAVDQADYTVVDNGDGTYTVNVAKAGTYYLVASDDDPITVPAVSAVTLTEKTVEPEPEVPDVETGDHTVTAVWVSVSVVSLALAAVVLTLKKRSQI